MQFLGTAAADALPGPFCACPICEDARRHPERMRLRSMFLLDEKNLIDCGPDLAAAAMKHRLNLSGLERIFITHTHEDHFCPSNAGLLSMSRTRGGVPMDVYLSQGAYEQVLLLLKTLGDAFDYFDAAHCVNNALIRLHPLATGIIHPLGDYRVMAVDTAHRVSPRETAINYRFERMDGLKLLYACDTGLYEETTLEMLRGSRVDILVMEATWGSRTDPDTRSHLSGTTYLQMLDAMLQADVIRADTRCYATHINHKHDFNHDAFQKWFDHNTPFSVTVAYDGLILH
jgi:phosphoribosyl 1,2-cyclic phosphate phosphodiesterase